MPRVPDLGTKLDAKRREDMLRQDDEARRRKVTRSRTIIYKEGRNVNCDAVEKLLKEQSLTPNRVCMAKATT